MADLAIAKLVIQAVIRIAADEKTQRRVLSAVLIPVVALLLLVALVLHLITNPLSLWAGGFTDEEYSAVEQFQKTYGYNQSIGIHEKDYMEGSGQDYSGVVLGNAGEMQVVYFNQLDERWADAVYGSDRIGTHGCGPTSMSIVVSTLTEAYTDPQEMAQWAYEHGYCCPGNGSYHELIPAAAEAWGLSVQKNLSAQDVVNALSGGRLVVALMAQGHFTSGGHFIVLRGITADGNILVADPASMNRSDQEWELSLILEEARKGAGAGGPFWAIGR